MKKLLFACGIAVGLIIAVGFSVHAATVLFPTGGGTGTSTPPTYGQLLVGNSSGTYSLMATSSLGISGGGSSSWGSITGTLSSQTDLQNALDDKFSLAAWYATTTAPQITSLPNLSLPYTQLTGTPTIPTNTNQLTNGAGFITSYTETDPIFVAHAAHSITAGDITKLGNLSGTNTGDQTSVSGNAGTATKLATARTIAGVSFDGSANISLNNNAITNGAGYLTDISGLVSAGTNVSITGSGTSGSPYVINSSGGGASGGLSTSSPWTVGRLAQVVSNGAVTSIATSSLGLLTTDVAEGTNLYWTNTRFDNRLSATTSLPNLTTLTSLSLPASQLTGFGVPFYTYFSATTTDALAQGSTNKYWSNTLFDNRLSATTSLPALTTAANLGTVKTSLTGLLKASSGVLSAASAGTDYDLPVTVSGGLTRTTNNIAPTSGFNIPLTASTTDWNTAYLNRITSLTTSGTSGAATLTGNTLNIPQYQAAGTYVTGVTGTSNRITSSGGTTPAIDIAATYVGQSSITTLGTIGTGVWQGTAIADSYISSASTWNAKESALTFSYPLSRSSNTISFAVATSTPTIGNGLAYSGTAGDFLGGSSGTLTATLGTTIAPNELVGQPFGSGLLYASAADTSFLEAATTSASCSGTVSCTSFTVIGASPITITGSGGGGGVSTTSANTWTALQTFSGGATTTGLTISGLAGSGSKCVHVDNLGFLSTTTDDCGDNSTTIAAAIAAAIAAMYTAAATMTNKRITKRVLALSAGSATPAINTDSYDVVHITAQSADITSFTTNLTGTPVDGDSLRISITDNGTARALTWGASFESSTATLPTTTVLSTRLDVGFLYNTETSKWRCAAVA